MSVVEGSIGAFPRRLQVGASDWAAARRHAPRGRPRSLAHRTTGSSALERRPPAERSVTDDAFLGGALRILQPKDGYRAGVDAVLLAASAPAKAGRRERVLDVGAGVGVVGLAVARRIADAAGRAGRARPAAGGACARQHRAQRSLGARARDRGRRGAAAERPAGARRDWPKASITSWPTRPFTLEGRGTAAADAAKGRRQCHGRGQSRRLVALHGGDGAARRHSRRDPQAEALAGPARRLRRTLRRARAFCPSIRAGTRRQSASSCSGIKGSRAPLQLLPQLTLHGDDNGFRPEIERVLRRRRGARDVPAGAAPLFAISRDGNPVARFGAMIVSPAPEPASGPARMLFFNRSPVVPVLRFSGPDRHGDAVAAGARSGVGGRAPSRRPSASPSCRAWRW